MASQSDEDQCIESPNGKKPIPAVAMYDLYVLKLDMFCNTTAATKLIKDPRMKRISSNIFLKRVEQNQKNFQSDAYCMVF